MCDSYYTPKGVTHLYTLVIIEGHDTFCSSMPATMADRADKSLLHCTADRRLLAALSGRLHPSDDSITN